MLQYAFIILLRFYELYGLYGFMNLVEASLYCWLILKNSNNNNNNNGLSQLFHSVALHLQKFI